MRKIHNLLGLTLFWCACGPAPETTKPPESAALATKEGFFKVGHQFYLTQEYDSADVYLTKAYSMDAAYLEPLTELAEMHYALGLQQQGEKNAKRLDHFKRSFSYFAKLESEGSREPELYERLGELSRTLDDDKALVKYAKKNAEMYPYDRQYFNLGFAYFQAGDYQSVIKTQKEAIERFKGSTFAGSFYRQLGLAYMRIDRDQTAERTFDSGLKAADAVIAERGRADHNFKLSEECRRLVDDKIGMLVSLKSLHQTYNAKGKLQKVEQQLKELGYTK